MKKIFNRLSVLVFTLILIFSFTGCGGLLNGDKTLVLSSMQDNAFEAKLTLRNIYILSYSNGKKTVWQTWDYDSILMNSYVDLLELSDKGDNTFHVKNDCWSVKNKTYEYGWHEVTSSDTIPDAFMLGTHYYSSDDYYQNVSNIITEDNYIVIDQNDQTTWPPDFWLAQTGSSGNVKATMDSGHNDLSNIGSYDKLWVNLDGKTWVCLGNAK